MSTVNWGMLAKSAVDNETVEGAINRLIAVHEADPDSHLGVGESLQSHKASVIIDHAAASIIGDKIKDWEVIKVSGNFIRSDYHWFTLFESVDGFLKAGTVTAAEDFVDIGTSPVAFNLARLRKTATYSNNFSWANKRKIRLGVVFQTRTAQIIWLVTGSGQLDAPEERKVGFQVGNADLSGVVANGTSCAILPLGVTIATGVIYDLEVVFEPGVFAKFYVNGVYKGQLTDYLPTGTIFASILIECQIRTNENVAKVVQITYYDFWQEIK